MVDKDLTKDERQNYIEWCSLLSGYHVSCYEKMNDLDLKMEYSLLSTAQSES